MIHINKYTEEIKHTYLSMHTHKHTHTRFITNSHTAPPLPHLLAVLYSFFPTLVPSCLETNDPSMESWVLMCSDHPPLCHRASLFSQALVCTLCQYNVSQICKYKQWGQALHLKNTKKEIGLRSVTTTLIQHTLCYTIQFKLVFFFLILSRKIIGASMFENEYQS